MPAERDKHYPSRSGQTTLATAVTNITKPVTKTNFGSSIRKGWICGVDQSQMEAESIRSWLMRKAFI